MQSRRKRIVAVIGGAQATAEQLEQAEAIGAAIAKHGWVLVTGGRTGVMEAASKGAAVAGGQVIGILPGKDADASNQWVELSIATGIGDARNAIIARTADVLIAIGGSYGTLSEIALALKFGKPVISLKSWQQDLALQHASTVSEAISMLAAIINPATKADD